MAASKVHGVRVPEGWALEPKVHGVRVPEGWALEALPRLPDYALLSTPPPMHYMVTIDFHRRGFRTGCSVSAKFVGEEWNKMRKKYRGRGWKQALVDDAVAHLRKVLGTQ
jgi:hypothetical protein